ncbi:chain-length determining protein [Bradyrhizobium tropiciagri]|uniref:GumC family protein n=1 Tax=Bradyrhizobium tropiciagri TaxID=312253 RepID=UPI001BACE726|nr:exopolysaccharide transport family protein [Bradyrhizobium tropiciagri]MBR0872556.1 chain-length determining protein [Bradyrhizobium tropiciagri]
MTGQYKNGGKAINAILRDASGQLPHGVDPQVPNVADSPVPNGVDFKDVTGILFRRKAWVFGVAAAFCAMAVTYVAFARPAYTATAEVYVDPRDRPTPKDEPSVQNSVPGDGLLLVESQLKIITSGEVLTRVVDEMKLASDPDFNGRNDLTGAIKALLGLSQNKPPELVALRNLRLNTAVKRNDRSFVIDIMVSARTPEQAARLTNAVANAFLEGQASANSNFNRRISDAITSQLDRMRASVNQSEQAVAAYKAANNLVGARNRLVTEQELDEANTQLTNAKTRLNEILARVKVIESIEAGGAQLEALPEAVQSATIAQLRARAADASREEAQLALINGPNHPALRSARAQLQDVQVAIKNEVKLIAAAVRNAAAGERTNVQTLQARFDSLKKLSENNEKVMVPLRELERKADSDRALYETFLAKAKTAGVQEVIDTTNIRLISQASPPDRKSWPPTAIILAVALFGGLSLGVVLALARESLDNGGGGAPKPTARRVTVSPPLQPEVVAPVRTERPVRLRDFSAELLGGPSGHSVLLVRASSEASLDLVALELARSVEEAGQKVMVIDADLARHPVTARLRFGQHAGFRDVLAGKSAIGEVARALGRTNIQIVPVGITKLASPDRRMRALLSTALIAARGFDCVIIDGGELGGTPSEFGLYAMADEVIFLESARGARTDDAQVLAELLKHNRIKAKFVIVESDPETVAA